MVLMFEIMCNLDLDQCDKISCNKIGTTTAREGGNGALNMANAKSIIQYPDNAEN